MTKRTGDWGRWAVGSLGRWERGATRRLRPTLATVCPTPYALLFSLLVSLSPCLVVSLARADRLVLAPRGLITVPSSAKIEFATGLDCSHRGDNLGWVSAGLPGSLNGFEVEVERFEVGGVRRVTGSLQYSFTGNAFTDIAPALSVGIRDVVNQGREGRAIFAAATKSIKLSQQQERLLQQLWVDAGYGTGHLGGAYFGIQGRLQFGPTLSAEYLARRFNASIGVPVVRHLDLKAYSLNGQAFYGASFYLVK